MRRITILAALFALLCLVQDLSIAAESDAPVTGPTVTVQPRSGVDIVVISRTSINLLTAGDNVRHYRNIEESLYKNLDKSLGERGLRVEHARSEESLGKHSYSDLLAFKIEALEFGFKNPFGRHTTLRVSYVFEGQKGTARGEYTQFSTKGWKNCVLTISQKIAGDVANRLAGKEVIQDKAPAEQRKTYDNTQDRLKNLEEVKAKGLITEEEYAAKRQEILKDL